MFGAPEMVTTVPSVNWGFGVGAARPVDSNNGSISGTSIVKILES